MRYVRFGLAIGALTVLVAAAVLRSTALVIVAGFVVALLAWQWRDQFHRLFVACCLATSLLACTQIVTRPALEGRQPCRFALQGRLIDSDPSELPPGVASAVSDSARIGFRYGEEVTHDHYTVPVALGLVLSPLDLLGAPLGQYTVTTKATLSAIDGGRELATYHGEAQASRWYGLYYGSTYRELEREARSTVRRIIDEALCYDAERLGRVVGTTTE